MPPKTTHYITSMSKRRNLQLDGIRFPSWCIHGTLLKSVEGGSFMRISYVNIYNYRAIRDSSISLSPFVCIVGENNAGKSTVLLALSLFFSGTKLSPSEFHDPSKPIRIEVQFEEVTDGDLNRLPEEHREKTADLIFNQKLKLVRIYETDGSSDLLCKRLMPKDERFDWDRLTELMKGKRGNAIRDAFQAYMPEYSSSFETSTTQAAVKEAITHIISGMSPELLEERDSPLPTGIPNSIKNLLPEPILIPAVKDVTDDIKTKESATFGKLIGILLRIVESTTEVQQIIQSFEQLHALLNKVKAEDGETADNRLLQIKDIENLMNTHLQESFPKVQLELIIPRPELKQVFSTAQILLDDGVKDIVETKGDGLKRSVTFALLRSYVDMKRKHKTANNHSPVETVVNTAPYLFLFEEPELYLHPSAQRILFDALGKISEEHQVIVTTHSPLFFSPTAIGTFIKMIKKYPDNAKPHGEPISINLFDDLSSRDAFQIICFENNSAAFFAKKVVLVEGDSDLCYFKHVAKVLNGDWDFDAKNIPVVRINGKGNVKRYKEFFKAFEMDVHVLVDLDVLIGGFDQLGMPKHILNIRSQLLETVDQIAVSEGVSGAPTAEKIKEIVRRYSWRERYERLKQLAGSLCSGAVLSTEEIQEINFLFSEEVETKRKLIIQNIANSLPLKEQLLKSLRDEKIYVLSKGTVEDYYPVGVVGEDKPSKALHACTLLSTREKVIEVCPLINHKNTDTSEFEVIFDNIFS